MKQVLLILSIIIASIVIGASSVYQPLFMVAASCILPLFLLFYKDHTGMHSLKLLIALTLLIPFQSYSFHLNGKFFLFPPFLLIQLLFVGLLITGKIKQLKFGLIDLFFFVFFTSAVISSFQAVENPLWAIRYLYVILFGGYVFYLTLKTVSHHTVNLAQHLYSFINIIVVGAASYGVIEYMLQMNFLYPHVPFYDLSSPGSSVTIYRSSSTFEHPLTAVLIYSLFLPYNALRFLVGKEGRIQYGIFATILFIGIQVTGSRVGVLYLLIAILFIIFLSAYGKLFKFHVYYWLVSALMVMVPAAYLLFNNVFARTFSIIETGLLHADLNRAQSVIWALRVFSDYWVWGMGPYNSDFLKSYQAIASGLNISSEWGIENSWVSLLLEQGVMGAIPFLLMQVYCVLRLLSRLRHADDSSANKIIMISLIIGFFMLNLSFATRNASHSYMTWILFFFYFFLSEGICAQAKDSPRLHRRKGIET